MRTVLCDFQVNYNEKQDIPRFQGGGDHSFFSGGGTTYHRNIE